MPKRPSPADRPWLDTVDRRIVWPPGRATAAAAQRAPVVPPAVVDVLLLPPVAAGEEERRHSIAEPLSAAGFRLLDQRADGVPMAPIPGATAVVDLLASLLERSPVGDRGVPAGAVVVVPLLPAVSDEESQWRPLLAGLRQAAPAAVVGFAPELTPTDRRRLVERLGEEQFERIHHRSAPTVERERAFARAVAAAGLSPFFERPELALAPRAARNRSLATALSEIGERKLALGHSEAESVALLAAARFVEGSEHDLVALAREGQLALLPLAAGAGRRRGDRFRRRMSHAARPACGVARGGGRSVSETLGIYLHVPFCRTKCRYCDFYRVGENRGKIELFLAALRREVEGWTELHGREVETIFLGGGTPSLLDGRDVASILERIARRFRVRDDAEITLEANPSDLSSDRLAALRAAGVNRLSIGVQSFSDRELRLVGRRHDAEHAERVVHEARDAGFDNLSIDLMLAIPGQTEASFRRSLERAVALATEHLSLYLLEVHESSEMDFLRRERPGLFPARRPSAGATWRCTGGCSRPATSTTRSRTSPVPAAAAGTTCATGDSSRGSVSGHRPIRSSTGGDSATHRISGRGSRIRWRRSRSRTTCRKSAPCSACASPRGSQKSSCWPRTATRRTSSRSGCGGSLRSSRRGTGAWR
ncbi:MAG: coproporphyrinogen-III oxidase family protein [Thermoanaerobaculia bacterium]